MEIERIPRYDVLMKSLWRILRKPAGFAGMVTAVAAWSIWGSEMFPAEKDPTGGDYLWADSQVVQTHFR